MIALPTGPKASRSVMPDGFRDVGHLTRIVGNPALVQMQTHTNIATAMNDMYEDLGQLIGYARTNHVVPAVEPLVR